MSQVHRISVLDVPAEQQHDRSEGTYETFWNVQDPYLLVKKVLSQRAARKYFGFQFLYRGFYCETNEEVRVDFSDKDKYYKIITKDAKKKTLFSIYAEKDTKVIQIKKMKKLIRAKLREPKLTPSLEESIQLWQHCSGSLDATRQNQGYYQRLLNQEYVDFYHHQIVVDIKRSQTLVSSEEQLQKMHNIFIAYARRNSTIGYCQGFNYIVAYFLKFNIPEEESFWLLVQLLEDVLPLDYYPSMMMGVVCDLKIVEQLLRRVCEKLYNKLQTFEVNVLSMLLTQWIVCLFTQALDESLLIVAWNYLFSKGSIAIFKICLVLLKYCEKEILNADGIEVVKEVEKKIKDWKDVKRFRKELESIYINERGINFMRELYKQICLIQLKLRDEQQLARRNGRRPNQQDTRFKNMSCNVSFPVCIEVLKSESETSNLPPEFFVFRTDRTFKIDPNYFELGRLQNDQRNVPLNESNILQTLHDHICPDAINQKQLQQQQKQQQQHLNQLSESQEQEESKNPVDDDSHQRYSELSVRDLTDEQREVMEQSIRISNISDLQSPRKKMRNDLIEQKQQQQLNHLQQFNQQQEKQLQMSQQENEEFEPMDNSNSIRFFSNISKTKQNYNFLVTTKVHRHSLYDKTSRDKLPLNNQQSQPERTFHPNKEQFSSSFVLAGSQADSISADSFKLTLS